MCRIFFSFVSLAVAFPVDPSAPPLCNFEMPTDVKIGTVVPLCVFMMSGPVGDPTSSTYVPSEIKSIGFGVPLDQYAMLDLSNSFSTFNAPLSDRDNLYAWVTGAPTATAWPRECALNDGVSKTFTDIVTGIAYSCPQLVQTVNKVIPVASIVAVVTDGVLVNLIWDNQCQTCPVTGDDCLAGNLALTLANATATQEYLTANLQSKITDNSICGTDYSNCLPGNTTGINCDFRILLTWDGTDVDQKRLTSSFLRMTQFSGQSVGSMWDSVANSFDPNDGVNSGNTENLR